MAVDVISAKVQRMLIGEFGNVRLTKDGGFAIDIGSTVVFIEIKEWTPENLLTAGTHVMVITHSGGGSINIDSLVVPAPTATPTRTPTSNPSQ